MISNEPMEIDHRHTNCSWNSFYMSTVRRKTWRWCESLRSCL